MNTYECSHQHRRDPGIHISTDVIRESTATDPGICSSKIEDELEDECGIMINVSGSVCSYKSFENRQKLNFLLIFLSKTAILSEYFS